MGCPLPSLADILRFAFALLIILGSAVVNNVYAEPEACPCHVHIEQAEQDPCEEACPEGCLDCTCCGSHLISVLAPTLDGQSLSYLLVELRTLSAQPSASDGVSTPVFVPPRCLG